MQPTKAAISRFQEGTRICLSATSVLGAVCSPQIYTMSIAYVICHPIMSFLLPHLPSNHQLSEVFPLSLPVAFRDNALGTPVVFCIFAI